LPPALFEAQESYSQPPVRSWVFQRPVSAGRVGRGL